MSIPKRELKPVIKQVEATVDILDEQLLSKGNTAYYSNAIENIKNWYTKGTIFSSTKVAESLVWLNYLVAESAFSKSLERLTAERFNTVSNEYPKAIDGIFTDGLKAGSE